MTDMKAEPRKAASGLRIGSTIVQGEVGKEFGWRCGVGDDTRRWREQAAKDIEMVSTSDIVAKIGIAN